MLNAQIEETPMPAQPNTPFRLAILYPDDLAQRRRADPAESRFADLFNALALAGVRAEPAVYHDDFVDEVRAQLLDLDGVLVWHNPIEAGRSRRILDALLGEVARQGVLVSTPPETILRLGTKDVLLAVRGLPFGSDVYRVDSLDDLRNAVIARLARGPRVLKQPRGQSGLGVWRLEAADGRGERFRIRHAQRGASEEMVDLAGVMQRLAPYFEQGGYLIDQAWQPRLVEGMVRAYLVRDRVAGFGQQAVNALFPAAAGMAPPEPGPRLYSGPDDPRFQVLRQSLEQAWVGLLCERTGLDSDQLPLLWDADFLLGDRLDDAVGGSGGDSERYVLCEINASCVAPFPPSAMPTLVAAVIDLLQRRAAAMRGN